MKNLKAELTGEQVVMILILVLTLGVLLFFVLMTEWNPAINKESCHESVVFRATSNTLIETSRIIPLKCETEKICLSRGGDCAMIGKASKQNPVTKIKINKNNEKAREQIKEIFANALYDCHSMLGEGKLNFMPKGWTDKNYCLICAKINLDKNLLESVSKEEIKSISFGEMYEYLQKKKLPSGMSYLEYLHPGWKNWRNIIPVYEEYKKNAVYQEIKDRDFNDWKINLDNENGYVVISQIRKPGTWKSWVYGGATAVVGSAALMSGIGAPVGISILAAGAGGGAVTWYSHPGGAYDYAPSEFYPYEADELDNIQCTSFESAP